MQSEVTSDHIEEQALPTGVGEEVHLLDLVILLSKRRKFIAWFTFAATVVAVITVLLLPSQFTAETTVLPPGQNSSLSSGLLGQLGGTGALASVAGASLGMKNTGDMYVALFRSRTIEEALIQRFGLMQRYHAKKMSGARSALEGHTKVVLGAKDGLIYISATDRDPQEAAALANGYVDEFKKRSADLAITEASQRRVFFEQQMLDAKEHVAAAEEAMKNTQQSTGVFEIDSQARSLIESAAALRAQVVAKEVQLQSMRSYATEDNPEMILAQQQLSALKSQLAELAGNNQDVGAGLIVPKGRIPEAGLEYIRKVRDLKYYVTISELIARQFEMAKLDEARQGAVIQVVDTAVPPDTRSFPKRTILVLAVLLASCVCACVWSIVSEGFHRLKTSKENRHRMEMLRATFE